MYDVQECASSLKLWKRTGMLDAHVSKAVMPPSETFAERVARQLRALMERHKIDNSAMFMRRQIRAGIEPPINELTIRRYLEKQTKEPTRASLATLARSVGETLEQAFPTEAEEIAQKEAEKNKETAQVEIDGRRIGFKGEWRPEEVALIEAYARSLRVEDAEDAAKAKREHREKRPPRK